MTSARDNLAEQARQLTQDSFSNIDTSGTVLAQDQAIMATAAQLSQALVQLSAGCDGHQQADILVGLMKGLNAVDLPEASKLAITELIAGAICGGGAA